MRNTNALEQLANAARRDERRLRYESGFVDESRRAILTRLADTRRSSVQGLGRGQVAPGAGPTGASLLERVQELGRAVRVAVGGRNSGDAVASCRRSVGRAEALYDSALTLPWPNETVAIFVQQRGAVRAIGSELLAIQF